MFLFCLFFCFCFILGGWGGVGVGPCICRPLLPLDVAEPANFKKSALAVTVRRTYFFNWPISK